jgi:putative acetyltransferase
VATVTLERVVDRGAIDALLVASFPTSSEARLVHALRERGELTTSLVADVDQALVGHVAFSPVTIDHQVVPATGLAPIAVCSAHRGRGLAGDLVRAGLEMRRAAGDGVVVVLGEPELYGRFGFRPASSFGLVDIYGGGDAFQAIELRPGAAGGGGTVRYAAAFDDVPVQPPEVASREGLALILALGRNGALGKGGGLPWDLPEDRAHFERTTRGHPVILGRRTWEETGRALEGRRNIVVSTQHHVLPGATVVPTLEQALRVAREHDPLPFVIGGRRLFEEALPLSTRVYLTEVDAAPEADVFVHLDRSRLVEVASWTGRDGERYVVLEPAPRLASPP